MYPAYNGSVRIDGEEAPLRSVQAAIERGIAYVPEDRLGEGLFLTQTINRNLLASSYGALAHHGFIDYAEANERSSAMIKDMQIADHDRRPAGG